MFAIFTDYLFSSSHLSKIKTPSRSIFERMAGLFSYLKATSAATPPKPLQSCNIDIEDFVQLESDSKSTPLSGLLGSITKIFSNKSETTIYESLLAKPLMGMLDLEMSNRMAATAQFQLQGKVDCKIELSLDPTNSTESLAEMHPLVAALLDQSIQEKLKNVEQLNGLIHAFSNQQTSLEWNGSERSAVLNIYLPGNGHLKMDLKFLQDLSALEDDIPVVIKMMIPQEVYEMLPGIMPLAGENFRFEWNGKTSQFALDFESPQVIKLTSLTLKGNAVVKLIGRVVGETLKINLPRRIAGHIDPKTHTVHFDRDTLIKVKFNKLERLGQFVQLNQIQYDPTSEKLHINIHLFGFSINIPIDLKVSMIEKKTLTFVPKVGKQAPYAASILVKPTQTISPTGSNQHVSALLSTLRSFVSKSYQPLFDIIAECKSSIGNLTCDLQARSLHAMMQLSDELTCKAILKFPDKTVSDKEIKLNQEVLNQINSTLQTAVKDDYNVDEIVPLLLKLPTKEVVLNWEGAKGVATLNMNLPGGASLMLELSSPKLVGKTANSIPPVMEKLMSHFAFKELFTSLKPFFSSDFALTWDGTTSEFGLTFKQEQQLHIQEIQLPKKGPLNSIAQFVGNNSFVRIPGQIKGKINFEDLLIEFTPKLTFNVKSGIFGKEIDIRKIRYHNQEASIGLDFNCLGSHSVKIPLKASEPQKKTAAPSENVKLKFSVGPVKSN